MEPTVGGGLPLKRGTARHLSPSMDELDQLPVAIEIRCARGKGRCGELRGRALALPQNNSTTPSLGDAGYALFVTNSGTRSSTCVGRMDALVPASFEGSCELLFCSKPGHDRFVDGRTLYTSSPPPMDDPSLWERYDEIVGGGLGLDCRLLHRYYAQFRATGRTQPLRWAPGKGGTAVLTGRRSR